MKTLTRKLAVLAVLVALSNGCGTILATASERPRRPLVYGGVQLDVMALLSEAYVAPFAILDLPLSAILDTLLLPIAIPMSDSAPARHP